MMSNPLAQLTWTFNSECEVPTDVSYLLIAGESPIAAYKTIRDVAIFTNKRLILRDAQGLSGKKV
ncbi:PH domain-containing protein, partial [Acinetobacter soli]